MRFLSHIEIPKVVNKGDLDRASRAGSLEPAGTGSIRDRHRVSLFDFGPSATDESGQFGRWKPWFGAEHNAKLSVWLEVDRNEGRERIVDAEELRLMWHEEMARRRREGENGPWPGTIFPGVEGAYPGAVPIHVLKRAVVMGADCSVYEGLGSSNVSGKRRLSSLLGERNAPNARW